jgi:branched-subunit amino acid aminotransferase/4-amino-4-deoxychorismate lyase
MLMEPTWAYLNGEWVCSTELKVAVEDIGFLLGATVTERLRTFGGRVFRLNEHLQRLRRSLEIVGLDAESITSTVADAITEFLQRNHGKIAAEDDWSIVAFVTPGRPAEPGARGSGRPTICVHGHPLPFHLWAVQFDAGVRVVVSDVRQVPTNCWPAELKCRSRMHYYLADRAAAAQRPGARAILLDQDGFVAEASTANVLVYCDGEGLVSPPHKHILAGVSLGVVHELSGQIGVPLVTRPLSVAELHAADEAMLTSTSVCVLPIVECDGRAIGNGKPGPIYRQLLTAWSELVGLDVAEQARQFAIRN